MLRAAVVSARAFRSGQRHHHHHRRFLATDLGSSVRGRVGRFFNKAAWMTGLGVVGTVGAGVAFASVTVIPAGHVGVVSLFGNVRPLPLHAGLHVVNPLTNVDRWPIQTRNIDFQLSVPSQEGAMLNVDCSMVYRLSPAKVPALFETVGTGYEDVVIKPVVHSCIRSVSSSYDAKAFYTSATREQMSASIFQKLSADFAGRGIIVESVPLRRVTLPEALVRSIEDKLKADQDNQRMEFILLQARQEAERKAIEARGIADFQNIVSQGITDDLLRWRGIEATVLLAQSTNAKVIVIGGGGGAGGGLPLIFNEPSSSSLPTSSGKGGGGGGTKAKA